MAITYPLTFPTQGVSSVTMRQASVIGGAPSPFTGHIQTHEHQGAWWEMDVSYPPLKAVGADAIVASFLVKLKGILGTFNAGDPSRATPRGTAKDTPGSPVVNGASQTGDELDIDGLPINETGYLLAGDYFQLGSGLTTRLHMVLDNVDSDGAGAATMTIWPNLRESPSNGATVVVSSAVGLFRLTSNVAQWNIDTAKFYGIIFSAREVL